MLRQSICFDFWQKRTRNKRPKNAVLQRVCDIETFHISPEFITEHHSFCYSVLVPRKMSFSLKHWHCTVNYFTCLRAYFGIITAFSFIICQNVVCLDPNGDQVVIERTFKVMKIQYSRNHRDLEGEQAMKTKQSLKWHPDSTQTIRFDQPSQINVTLWSS